jgi:hypothetical protein
MQAEAKASRGNWILSTLHGRIQENELRARTIRLGGLYTQYRIPTRRFQTGRSKELDNKKETEGTRKHYAFPVAYVSDGPSGLVERVVTLPPC